MVKIGQIFLLGAACIALALSGTPLVQKRAQWAPPPGQVEKLASYSSIGDCEFRPPKGYVSKAKDDPAEFKATLWMGPARPNGTRAGLTVVQIPEPPPEIKPTIEDIVRLALEDQKRRRTEWKAPQVEKGEINGIAFVRAYWSGASPQYQQKLKGFFYIAKVGRGFLQFGGQDVEPFQKDTLPLAEASVMTLRKRK